MNHSSTQKTLEIHTRIFSAGKITCKARSAGAIFQASFKDSCQGFSSGLRYEQANGFARGHRMHTRLHTQNIKESVGLVQQCAEIFFSKKFQKKNIFFWFFCKKWSSKFFTLRHYFAYFFQRTVWILYLSVDRYNKIVMNDGLGLRRRGLIISIFPAQPLIITLYIFFVKSKNFTSSKIDLEIITSFAVILVKN